MTKRLKTRSWHQIPYSLFWALGISCRDNFSQLQLSWMTGVIPAYNLTSSSGSHGLHLTIQYTTLYTKSTTLLPTSSAQLAHVTAFSRRCAYDHVGTFSSVWWGWESTKGLQYLNDIWLGLLLNEAFMPTYNILSWIFQHTSFIFLGEPEHTQKK